MTGEGRGAVGCSARAGDVSGASAAIIPADPGRSSMRFPPVSCAFAGTEARVSIGARPVMLMPGVTGGAASAVPDKSADLVDPAIFRPTPESGTGFGLGMVMPSVSGARGAGASIGVASGESAIAAREAAVLPDEGVTGPGAIRSLRATAKLLPGTLDRAIPVLDPGSPGRATTLSCMQVLSPVDPANSPL